jgi:hypothetical protein
LAEKIGVSKFQVSHIEKSNRGVSRQVLSALISKLTPSLKELEELREIVREENVGIDLIVKRENPGNEFRFLKAFGTVHVVASHPLEVTEINTSNRFITSFADDLEKAQQGGARRSYTYWTQRNSLDRFCTLFDFLESRYGINAELINSTFNFVLAPQELGLINFAVYQSPISTETDEYDRVGRLLLRTGLSPSSFDIVKMGDADLQNVWNFLQLKLEDLTSGRAIPGYELLSAQQLREKFDG